MRIHDLRHALASVAASSAMGLPIIGKMLEHSQPATAARYAPAAAAKIAMAMGNGVADAGKDGAQWCHRAPATDH